MFCFQCQETAKNTGCTVRGVCGKEETTANLQDLLIFNLKGIAVLAKQGKAAGVDMTTEAGRFVTKALFTTITNVNFNDDNLVKWIKKAQEFKKTVKDKVEDKAAGGMPDAALWFSDNEAEYQEKPRKSGFWPRKTKMCVL